MFAISAELWRIRVQVTELIQIFGNLSSCSKWGEEVIPSPAGHELTSRTAWLGPTYDSKFTQTPLVYDMLEILQGRKFTVYNEACIKPRKIVRNHQLFNIHCFLLKSTVASTMVGYL